MTEPVHYQMGVMPRRFVMTMLLLAGCLTSPAAVDFARDIQPILAGKCFECHGPDKRKGGLRLDLKADALQGGDDGQVLVAGNADASLLVKKISEPDPDKRMPAKGEPLSAREVELIRRWINEGATWPDDGLAARAVTSQHWAFQTVHRFAVPAPAPGEQPALNPIDAFVRSRLAQEQIKPSPEAGRYTLIRRLSFDLLGLPPTPEQVRAFINDQRPDAYEQLVDSLLGSPHFGERWGRHWLDLARYADSDGYEKDRPRPYAYLYRDWVIDAINRDLPFDQFSIEQLAGDLLPNPTHEQLVATGFHRQTLTNTEGGVDQEEFRCKAVVDRVSTTSTVWMGVTMGCAECHSHKYDPFTQREFYQLFAFFNNASEKNLPAPTAAEAARYKTAKAQWDKEHKKLEGALAAYVKETLPARFDKWTASVGNAVTAWKELKPLRATSKNGATLTIGKDHVVLSVGKLPDQDTYEIETHSDLSGITGFRLEAIDDPAPKQGPGRAKDGNFVLTGFKVLALLPDGSQQSVELGEAKADFSQSRFPVANALAGDNSSGWAVSPQLDQSHVAVFETREDLQVAAGARLIFSLDHQYKTGYLLQRFRLSATTAARPLQIEGLPAEVAAVLAKPVAERSAKEDAVVLKHYREQVDPEARKLQAAIAEHAKKSPKSPETFAAVITPEPKGRTTQIHVRGNFLDKGAEVKPGTPSVLSPLRARTDQPDRLDLARWLFAQEHPLTARVAVNHVWKNLFGRGLVATIDDFGTRGEKPSHPELLDWLASEFPRLGWSRKQLIKLIVTSATYRQSSLNRPELDTIDPLNTLLARQNRLRMEAETVRDAFLAAGGLLAPEVGGPSIRPPLPDDIAALGYANSVKWTESKGEDKYRRGLYIFFQRTVPYPMLMTFDAPDSNATCTRRERSNTPLQALTLLNDPVFFECAQSLGQQMAAVPTSDVAEKLRHGFLSAISRPPTEAELARLQKLHQEQRALLEQKPEVAASVLGLKEANSGLAEQASYVALARVILNLDEFITRD